MFETALEEEMAGHLGCDKHDLDQGPRRAGAEQADLRVDTADLGGLYPDFAALARIRGVSHVPSVGLPVPQRLVGALNMCSDALQPFPAASVTLAETFAGYAAVALANAALHRDAFELVNQMRIAMASRAVVEQAKGVLVARLQCTPDEASRR